VYSSNNEIYNNTIYNVRQFGIEVLSSASGSVIKNNLSYRNGMNYVNNGSGTTAANNSFSGIDPQFIDSSAGDFRLRSTSALIDAGVPVSLVSTDILGVARPQHTTYDIGAYEFTSETSLPATPTSLPATPTGVRIAQ
jgi:parallel beta-helix repeat protein